MRSLRESEWEEFFGEEYPQYSGHFDSSGSSTNTTLIPLPTHAKAPLDFLSYLDFITTAFFSVEFILRFIFCPNKKKFISSFLNLVDIFSLCVMYSKYIVEAINPREKYTATVFDIVHCFQIVRVFRLFRLVKNFIGFRVLLYALKASIWEVLLMSLFLVVAMLMFSAFVFFSGDTAFTSIPDAFWWAIVTMTTVGYGDMYPTQPLSKTIGAVCAVTGVCLLAIIIPIFVNNFLLFYAYSKVWGSKDNANTNKGGTKKNNIISSKSKVSPDCWFWDNLPFFTNYCLMLMFYSNPSSRKIGTYYRFMMFLTLYLVYIGQNLLHILYLSNATKLQLSPNKSFLVLAKV